MKCKQYLFKLTSGQLQDASRSERVQAALHLLVCSRCRAFTRNDAALSRIVHAWCAQLQSPEEPSSPVGSSAHSTDDGATHAAPPQE